MEAKSNDSVEQSDVANRIDDLTNEVRCLKNLFATKEVIRLQCLTHTVQGV